MKSVILILVIVQAVYVQHCFSQCIRNCGNLVPSSIVMPSTVAVAPSVANSLADTLSLLTVSSLLAETLPLNPNVIATMPVPVAPAAIPVVNGCGCGVNGYGGIGVIGGSSNCGNPGCGLALAPAPIPVVNGCGCGLNGYGGIGVIGGSSNCGNPGCGLALAPAPIPVVNGCGCGLNGYGGIGCGLSCGNPGCGLGYGYNYLF